MELGFTLVKRKMTPLVQVGVSLLIGWIGIVVFHFVKVLPASEYLGALIGIIFFCIMNTIVSISYNSFLRYTVPSYYLYIALVAVLFLSSKFLSGISIWDLWEYRMMLVSISIFFFIISTLVRGVRFIYEMAEGGM